jgi:hypothetical protein
MFLECIVCTFQYLTGPRVHSPRRCEWLRSDYSAFVWPFVPWFVNLSSVSGTVMNRCPGKLRTCQSGSCSSDAICISQYSSRYRLGFSYPHPVMWLRKWSLFKASLSGFWNSSVEIPDLYCSVTAVLLAVGSKFITVQEIVTYSPYRKMLGMNVTDLPRVHVLLLYAVLWVVV